MIHNGFWITIISHGRATNVHLMHAFAPRATWYVKDTAEAEQYAQAGAPSVIASGGLIASRNQALDDAFAQQLWCVQLSDDLRRMRFVASAESVEMIQLDDALGMIREAMQITDAYLGGVAPTDNTFYANVNRPVSTTSFVVGDFIVVRPNALRFDPELALKEDYDYTAQHIKHYGRVARCNLLLMSYQHNTNPGGAVSYRTPMLEEQTIHYLKQKHGGWIVDNPKRKHQIILKPR
jgi:hypothetical protein